MAEEMVRKLLKNLIFLLMDEDDELDVLLKKETFTQLNPKGVKQTCTPCKTPVKTNKNLQILISLAKG